jgi:hypothetical protein
MSRALRERVQSTVYVKVTCGGRTACERDPRVTSFRVDEWLDDTKNNPWLPSFVLPRDRSFLKIITRVTAIFDWYRRRSGSGL